MTFKLHMTKRFAAPLTALATAVLLAACGGGDPRTTAVKVVGDSLNDSGTFGYKFTVQGTATAPNLIWTEHVAAALDAPALCPRYTATGPTSVALSLAATTCTSYGVGAAQINMTGTTADATPFSIVQQLKDLAASGNFGAEELLLVDGGGNDAATMIAAYLAASTDGGASYVALLGELLTPTQMSAINPATPSTLVTAGAQYMTALADVLSNTLTTQALDKGAKRIVIMNAPNLTRTPKFQNVLLGVAALAGQSTSDAVKVVAQGWVQAFNVRLIERFPASHTKVAVVDFYSELNKFLDTPAAYGLTNTSTPACPVTGLESGLPAFTIQNCTSASLSASPQPGTSGPDWWKTYVFSDHFHGTPKTNQLMGDLVLKTLEAKGWK